MATKYIRIYALKTRGPVEGGPDREVDGILLSAEEPALTFTAGHRDSGHDQVDIWPAFHDGKQVWIESRRWVAAHGYSAWGTSSRLLSLEEGIGIMVDRGVFRMDPPADDDIAIR